MSETMRCVLRTDGSREDFPAPLSMRQIGQIIGADCFDTVQLRHLGARRYVMLVDDTGLIDGKPINPEGTKLYHANCRPGATPIAGDVFVCPDGDFA